MPPTLKPGSGGKLAGTARSVLERKGWVVHSIGPDASVYEAIARMNEHQVGALFVIDDSRLLGVFSERDYARKLALRGLRSRDTPVSAVMSSPVLTIRPDASVQDGLEVMTEKYIRHLPVVDSSGVIGMVSIGDLVKAVIQDQQALIEQLESYLAR